MRNRKPRWEAHQDALDVLSKVFLTIVIVICLISFVGCSATKVRHVVPDAKISDKDFEYIKKEERKLRCFIRLLKYDVKQDLAMTFCKEIVR
tara:strand:- start:371 stop:646 length:276 start_codon:yes stop_codon:yes gene_type:complete